MSLYESTSKVTTMEKNWAEMADCVGRGAWHSTCAEMRWDPPVLQGHKGIRLLWPLPRGQRWQETNPSSSHRPIVPNSVRKGSALCIKVTSSVLPLRAQRLLRNITGSIPISTLRLPEGFKFQGNWKQIMLHVEVRNRNLFQHCLNVVSWCFKLKMSLWICPNMSQDVPGGRNFQQIPPKNMPRCGSCGLPSNKWHPPRLVQRMSDLSSDNGAEWCPRSVYQEYIWLELPHPNTWMRTDRER